MIKKIKNIFIFFSILLLLLIITDITFKLKGHGYNNEFNESHIERYPYPYDMFRSKPNVLDHNEDGFRGNYLQDFTKKNIIKIAFFGGSTGYFGSPPIPQLIENNLKQKNIDNVVFNFSSVASNHSQHIHRLVEFLDYNFDIVIFYGGGNESLSYYFYDTRPGYPYNFFIRNELSPFRHSLIRYSSIFGKIDKISGGSISGYKEVIKFRDKDYENWIKLISEDYLKKIKIAQTITEKSLKPEKCLKTSFIPIIQPINLEINLWREDYKKHYVRLQRLVESVTNNENLDTFKNLLNLSFLKNNINFEDELHINQISKTIVAEEITTQLIKTVKEKCN